LYRSMISEMEPLIRKAKYNLRGRGGAGDDDEKSSKKDSAADENGDFLKYRGVKINISASKASALFEQVKECRGILTKSISLK